VTKDALDYLQQLKRNTEQQGSIFDTQPSALTGNLHSLNDPTELVMGYLRVQNVSEKRIFIKHADLPSWFMRKPISLDCIDPNGLCSTVPVCSDCRLGGGVNVKPDYWIN
jgi:hypothetical protein